MPDPLISANIRTGEISRRPGATLADNAVPVLSFTQRFAVVGEKDATGEISSRTKRTA